MNFIFVGLGGALGAMLRYAISTIPFKGNFPVTTLIINFLGAVAIGFVTGISAQKGLSEKTLLFLRTGLCGGFTTFSTFSLESYTLLKSGYSMMAVCYSVISVVLCIAGIWIGTAVCKAAT